MPCDKVATVKVRVSTEEILFQFLTQEKRKEIFKRFFTSQNLPLIPLSSSNLSHDFQYNSTIFAIYENTVEFSGLNEEEIKTISSTLKKFEGLIIQQNLLQTITEKYKGSISQGPKLNTRTQQVTLKLTI